MNIVNIKQTQYYSKYKNIDNTLFCNSIYLSSNCASDGRANEKNDITIINIALSDNDNILSSSDDEDDSSINDESSTLDSQ